MQTEALRARRPLSGSRDAHAEAAGGRARNGGRARHVAGDRHRGRSTAVRPGAGKPRRLPRLARGAAARARQRSRERGVRLRPGRDVRVLPRRGRAPRRAERPRRWAACAAPRDLPDRSAAPVSGRDGLHRLRAAGRHTRPEPVLRPAARGARRPRLPVLRLARPHHAVRPLVHGAELSGRAARSARGALDAEGVHPPVRARLSLAGGGDRPAARSPGPAGRGLRGAQPAWLAYGVGGAHNDFGDAAPASCRVRLASAAGRWPPGRPWQPRPRSRPPGWWSSRSSSPHRTSAAARWPGPSRRSPPPPSWPSRSSAPTASASWIS